MFSGLIFGRIADATENIRLIALLVNLFQIVGQFMYFVGNNAYVLIFGRFLGGPDILISLKTISNIRRLEVDESIIASCGDHRLQTRI
jgi:hypothetical protein